MDIFTLIQHLKIYPFYKNLSKTLYKHGANIVLIYVSGNVAVMARAVPGIREV